LLFKHRTKLSPQVDREHTSQDHARGFLRERRRHFVALGELAKIEIRNADESIAGLEFLYEEYEPRCYLFPIFEMARRLFLTSVLAVFYPGSMQQVLVGLLGAMSSFLVYNHYEAFIEDDDDMVASVAQGQLVLIYFGALAVYVSDVTDQKREVFSGAAFGVVLVLIFFTSFVVAAYTVMLNVFGDASLRTTSSRISTVVSRTMSVAFSSNQLVGSASNPGHDDVDDERPSLEGRPSHDSATALSELVQDDAAVPDSEMASDFVPNDAPSPTSQTLKQSQDDETNHDIEDSETRWDEETVKVVVESRLDEDVDVDDAPSSDLPV